MEQRYDTKRAVGTLYAMDAFIQFGEEIAAAFAHFVELPNLLRVGSILKGSINEQRATTQAQCTASEVTIFMGGRACDKTMKREWNCIFERESSDTPRRIATLDLLIKRGKVWKGTKRKQNITGNLELWEGMYHQGIILAFWKAAQATQVGR